MSKFYLELAHSITDNEQEGNLKFPFSLLFLCQKTKKRRRRMSQRHSKDISEVVQPLNAIEEESNEVKRRFKGR